MKKYYLILFSFLFVLSACKSNKDKDLFESASAMYKANNFAGAAEEYQKLIDEYPDGKFTMDAYFALAGIYQMGKIQGLSKEDASKKAVKCYENYYKEFPNSDKTPKALFMIGFIRANDLMDYDSARISYNEFLKKYPDNELAASVKLELDNLGKLPEQIIEQNKSANK